jgi:hypothetical protein
MIIGLSGYARSGKDSVADILVEEFGYIRVAFADKLREALYALNPIVSIGVYEDFHWDYSKNVYVQDVIDEYGWDGVKGTEYADEIRRLLQRMGTEAGRNLLGNDIWVDAAFFELTEDKNYVFTDCRFSNEALRVRQYQGKVWRVTRPGVEPANDHISEIGLDNWPFDAIVLNDRSLEDLKKKVIALEAVARRV